MLHCGLCFFCPYRTVLTIVVNTDTFSVNIKLGGVTATAEKSKFCSTHVIGTEAPAPGGAGDGAPLGQHFATPTRGTGLGREAPPPGARHPPPGGVAPGEVPTPPTTLPEPRALRVNKVAEVLESASIFSAQCIGATLSTHADV